MKFELVDDAVSVDIVIEYLHKNSVNAQLILKEAVKQIAVKITPDPCANPAKEANPAVLKLTRSGAKAYTFGTNESESNTAELSIVPSNQ